ncbi:GNAT family N-acetyltransferase [Rossellomorea sp. GCM10028870]|uniref:GNAT family N-acetyltransferase n=1 Tax=Rossellomorea sp. GCM10028870 TaxID=3273426 RepID=UPI003618A2A4
MLRAEKLDSKHYDRVIQFQCSDQEEVESFLKKESFKLELLNIAKTTVFLDDDDNLIGYFTLFNDSTTVSNTKLKKMDFKPNNFSLYPSVRIHFFGVDSNYRKKGYGSFILFEALNRILEISKMTGCVFATVEALPGSNSFYSKHLFVSLGRKKDDPRLEIFVFKIKELDIEVMDSDLLEGEDKEFDTGA